MCYSFRLAARVLLYAPSHRQDNTYHGTLSETRNSSMGPPWRIDPTTHRTMSERSYHGATSRSIKYLRQDPIYEIAEFTISYVQWREKWNFQQLIHKTSLLRVVIRATLTFIKDSKRMHLYYCINSLKVALHQIKRLPGQSSRCTVKCIRSECNEGCDWCI